jgi:pilus assembly protein FimV
MALLGVVAALIVFLALIWKWRSGKRARTRTEASAAAADPRASRTFASLEEAQADADARNEALRQQKEREAQASEAAIEKTKPSPRNDDTGLNAVAARVESDEAFQTPATPTEETAPALKEATHETKPEETVQKPEAAPFKPASPAAHHAAFMPPPLELTTKDVASRDDADREAQKWEHDEREAAARQAAAQEAVEREHREREHAAREALARDLHARELQLLDAEAKQAAEQEKQAEQAREAAAREIIGHEAELRAAQAQAAEEKAAEQNVQEDEASPAHRFPMPKFPQEAIQALDSLEFGLPPRMELTLNLPDGPVTSSHQVETSPPASAQPVKPPIGPAPSIEEAEPYIGSESVASQIEAGTAGAGAVAGLGATQFAPLSLDFDSKLPRSHTDPLPPLTTSQLAAIARNKLELAGEYIELGDLPGARTLLQEVIAANDPATRQRAATMLSTLAPHS